MLLSNTSTDSERITSRSMWQRLAGTRKRSLLLLIILVIGFSVRLLTLQFVRAHLHDPSWFQPGSYAIFDSQAREILAGRQGLFLISDPSRTDLVQYPPGFPWLVALIYKLTGERSIYSVQIVVVVIDWLLSFVLIGGIALTAFGWRAAIAATFLTGISPILAMYGAWPSADAPTTWFVLAANWALLLAARRTNIWFALAAGILLGMACWLRVNPLYLSIAWAFALGLLIKAAWRQRLKFSAVVLSGTAAVVAPIVIRNYVTFPDFTPTGGTIGTNLWEGLGETELGRRHGFLYGDHLMVERERIRMGLPADFPLKPQWPDGIRRDQARIRESLAFIKQHPLWYAGVMLKRMWGMLKVAGDPLPFYGSNGINVTSKKCLSPALQGGIIAFITNSLGALQSVTRCLFLPLAAFGFYLGSRRDVIATGVLCVTIFYYLVPGTAAHTEIRYVLPMHGLLIVFAAVTVDWIVRSVTRQ